MLSVHMYVIWYMLYVYLCALYGICMFIRSYVCHMFMCMLHVCYTGGGGAFD